MSLRQLRLGAFMRPVSIHTAAWRYPGSFPDANFNLSHLKRFIQKLELGKFDAFFMADHLAVMNMPINALKRSHTVTSFEPFTLLAALAGAAERIGLVATASSTMTAPSRDSRSSSAPTHRNSIPMAHSRPFRNPTRARAHAIAWSSMRPRTT